MKQTEKKTIPMFKVARLVRDARATTTPGQTLVLWALTLRCDPADHYSCYPSYDLIAKDTRLNIGTVKRVVSELKAMGLISTLVRHNHSSIYWVDIAKLIKMSAANMLADKAEREAKTAKNKETGCPFAEPSLDDLEPTETGIDSDENDDSLDLDEKVWLGGAR
jgi:DNA-binding MarR family transcriptional regulator